MHGMRRTRGSCGDEYRKDTEKTVWLLFLQDCEIKEEGKKHFLTLYNVRLDQAGGVDFQAANAKSGAHLRVKRKCLLNSN